MPRVLEVNGYRFFFFSNEGDPRGPCHIHVRKGNALAKFWLEPEIELADSIGFTAGDLRFIKNTIHDNLTLMVEAWHECFNR